MWPPVKWDAIISEDGHIAQGFASWSLWSRVSHRLEIIATVLKVFKKRKDRKTLG